MRGRRGTAAAWEASEGGWGQNGKLPATCVVRGCVYSGWACTVFVQWVGLNCVCRDCVYRVGGPELCLLGLCLQSGWA